MSKLKSLDTLKYLRECLEERYYKNELDLIEKDLNILQIFKEAIEIERMLPPEIEMTKNNTFIFQEAIRVHEKRIEETVKQALRKWVLENACPNEIMAFEIVKEKGLSTNELWFIKAGKSWEEYTETMKEIYYDDESVENNLKTKGEYELLKEVIK